MAAATTDIALTEINPHLVFIPQKNQFKSNSDLNTLRDFLQIEFAQFVK